MLKTSLMITLSTKVLYEFKYYSNLFSTIEKQKKDYTVFQGVMKTSPQAVKIYKRLFPTDMESKKRFLGLMTAFQQGIVLADNIFLSYEDDSNKKKSDNLFNFSRLLSLCC